MTVEADIITTLTGYSALTALVSTRIYHGKSKQQDSYPRINFYNFNTNTINTLTGPSADESALFQFDIRATDLTTCKQIALQLRNAMEAATLFAALCTDQRNMTFDYDLDIEREVLDFSIWYDYTA